jgi:hypothetical protein
MKKTFIIIFFMLAILSVSSISMANAPEGHIYLPNGQTLDVRKSNRTGSSESIRSCSKISEH